MLGHKIVVVLTPIVLVALAAACCSAQKQDDGQPGLTTPVGQKVVNKNPDATQAQVRKRAQEPRISTWKEKLDEADNEEPPPPLPPDPSPAPMPPSPALERPPPPPANPWLTAVEHDAPAYTMALGVEGPQLLDGAGALLLNLVPNFEFLSAPGPGDSRVMEVSLPVPEWEYNVEENGPWQATGVAEKAPCRVTLNYSGAAGNPMISCEVTVEHMNSAYPQAEVLSFTSGPVGNGFVLHRNQHIERIDRTYFVDPRTYKLAFFGKRPSSFAFVGGFGVPSIRVTPGPESAYVLDLELDHADNHPLEFYEECHDRTSTKHSKYHADRQRRRKGERETYSFLFVAGNPTPVRISRLPRGFRGALSFTDHADQSSTEKLAALLYGDSKADPGSAAGGFIGHNLGFTKTVFSIKRGSYTPQLERPEYHLLLATAVGRQVTFEVGSHSPSGLRDKPEDSLSSLERLQGFQRGGGGGEPVGLVWIDHQPDTNCEAVTNGGWNPDSEWFMLEGLVQRGFRYFWSGTDVRLGKGELNMLRATSPDKRVSLLYANNRFDSASGHTGPLYLWPSFWTFSKRERFYKHYDDEALARLVEEDGIHIAHSYLDSFRSKGSYKSRSHFERKKGRLVMRAGMNETLERMEDYQERGELWVAGLGHIAEHLTKLPQVRIEYTPDGKSVVTNSGERTVRDLTLFLPSTSGKPRILVNGKAPPEKSSHGRRFFWFDLGPGKSAELQFQSREEETTIPFVAPVRLEASVN